MIKARPTDSPFGGQTPDKVADDGSTVERKCWTGGERNTCVALDRVIGGGQTGLGGPYGSGVQSISAEIDHRENEP